MKFNRIVLVVVSLALILFALAGCGKDTAQDSQKKLNVVATTTMLTDLVKEIGGDHVTVQGLMGPGVDPHLYQASAGDVTAMSKADVVVYNGIHLEGKMGSIFDNLTKQNKATIRVSDAIDPATLLDFDEEDGVKQKTLIFGLTLLTGSWQQKQYTKVLLKPIRLIKKITKNAMTHILLN